MDQIKSLFAVFMKYHFWVLTVLVVTIGVGGWFVASSGLAKQFETDKSTVNLKFSSIRAIQSDSEHPNKEMIADVRNQTLELAKSIRLAWDQLYERQRDEVLKWPAGLPQSVLDAVEGKKFPDEIPNTQRELYQHFIKRDFDTLPNLVEAQNPLAPADAYKVVWQDQDAVRAKFEWATRPTARTIWVAQEDRWVYEMLLTIIQRTNADATGPHDAPIKQIASLQIGNEVVPSTGASRIWAPTVARAAGGNRGGRGGRGGAAGAGRGGRGGAVDDIVRSVARLEGRYVAAAGLPVPPDQLASIVEYKRLPVRMTLKMDQRELPRLLAECANAALRVEVTEVRINAGAGGARAVPRAARGGGGRGGRGGGRGGRGGAAAAPRAPVAALAGPSKDPNLADVIVEGVVYLYNPPDLAKLGLPEDPAPAEAELQPVAALDETSTQ